VFSATFGGAAGLVTCGYEAVADTPEIEPGSRMGTKAHTEVDSDK
jgi:hypothetical protein